jgi:hypothetical protein
MGNADKWLQRFRCPLCKKSKQDYKDANLEQEVNEMEFLRETWLKCKNFKQITTGVARLDLVITILWGAPHTNNWRNYKATRQQVVHDSNIVLRLVRV